MKSINEFSRGPIWISELRKTRKILLDSLELLYGDTQQWSRVRSLVLRLFGTSGLEGLLDALCEDELRELNASLKNQRP